MRGFRTAYVTAAVLCAAAALAAPGPVRGNELRISTMGGCRIALDDEDNRLNPYDYGRNPACLLDDFESAWIRFLAGLEEESGDLRRTYDPHLVNDIYAGFTGIRKLSDRHIVLGSFRYSRILEREVYHGIEYDRYNDPFYLTDVTTGDFEYYGPTMRVDYALRLSPRFRIGLGFDYEISTGLKQTYTRPEIIHNYVRGNLGVLYEATDRWLVGIVARPVRHQNRTKFERPDEGIDNVINPYFGDGIYEIRSFSSYTITELLWGGELALQNFYLTDRFAAGAVLGYGISENKIRYSATQQNLRGLWQDESFDARLRVRYTPAAVPSLAVGLEGRWMSADGWAKRPEYDEVLLYENPVRLASVGGGVSYRLPAPDLVLSLEYVANMYDIEVNDYGASAHREADVVQNVGRLGLEYNMLNIYSIRGGVEATDYLVDRWIKLPRNTDRYRFTGGFAYHTGLWAIDVQLAYSSDTNEDFDASRRGLSGILWFTRLVQ